MGSAEELKAMAERRQLEPVEPSVARARALLADAKRSLATSRAIVAEDPKSALLLVWDGVAFPALAAALAVAGYRIANQMGHHWVAVEAGKQLFVEGALMSRIGSLRRARDRGMYESEGQEVEEVTAAIDDCEQLIELVAKAVERAASASGT
jgi:hypothetical protein